MPPDDFRVIEATLIWTRLESDGTAIHGAFSEMRRR